MSWLPNTLAGQQASANQGPPYGSSSNQYMINSNQENYLQALAGFAQAPGTHGSFPSSYWSALPPAMMFPPPPTASMLQQQGPLTNEQQSPQSKTSNHRSMTPTNANDLLSTSQPNQAQQFISMPRAAPTPGKIKIDRTRQKSPFLSSELFILRCGFTHLHRSKFNDATIETTGRISWFTYVSTTNAYSKYFLLYR